MGVAAGAVAPQDTRRFSISRFNRDLDAQKVRDLAALGFVRAHANVALLGPPGVGKSHLAVALAVAGCQAGFSIYFTSLDDMVRHLAVAERTGNLPKKLQTYLKPSLLVIDEIGYLPLDRNQANLVFQLVSRRYERGSVIITSNKAFSEWGQVFSDDVLATAILDRLLHHCDVVTAHLIRQLCAAIMDRRSLAARGCRRGAW